MGGGWVGGGGVGGRRGGVGGVVVDGWVLLMLKTQESSWSPFGPHCCQGSSIPSWRMEG